jgi:hypothetical protein
MLIALQRECAIMLMALQIMVVVVVTRGEMLDWRL